MSPDTGASAGERPASRAARLRRRLRELDPARFGLLGILSLPGYLFDSLAFMQLFALFFLLFFWVLVEPLLDYALERRTEAETEPTDWIHLGDPREWLVAYLALPLGLLNPLVFVQDLLQLLGSGVAYVRHRGSLPAAGDDPGATYRLPLEGTWTVVNGSLEKEYSHSWLPATQRYAYDFLITDGDGRSRPEGAPPSVGEYYCYGEPVLAPADGVVVDVLDSDRQSSRAGGFSHPLKRDLRGDYVTIQHAPDEYSCLAHLVPGSVAVEPGERVERGQRVARCGHSGNSSEPHLHFQVQDHPAFEVAAGLPVEFAGVDVESPWLEGDVSRTDDDPSRPDADGTEADDGDGDGDQGTTALTAGQRVTTRDPPTRPTDEPNSPPSAPDRRFVAGLERLAFGVVVAAPLTFVSSALVGLGPQGVALVLGCAALVGFGLRPLARRTDRVPRPGGLGTPAGFALVAASWVGVPTVRSPTTLAVLGTAAYVLVAEYDRYRLARSFGRPGRTRSGPEERRAGS